MLKSGFIITIILLWLSVSLPAFARYNPAWKWRAIKTENFTIYYPKGHEQFAQRVLSLTDEVYRDITGYLKVEPRHCPIILNPGTDQYNGFFTIFPNRISLYETPRYSFKGSGPDSDLIDLVFTHEFTHFAHITTRLGWYGKATRVIGEGLAISNMVSPGWVIEGITTNTETMFTNGGRGRSLLFEGQMMSFTEKPGIWPLSAAAVASPYAPPANRIYLAGYHMVEYLNRTYGEDTIARLGRYQARRPIRGTRKALKYLTRKSPKQFYREFLSDIETRAAFRKKKVLSDDLPDGRVILADNVESIISHCWTGKNIIKALRRGYDKKTALLEVDPVNGQIIKEIKTGRLYPFLPIRDFPADRLLFGESFYHPLGGGDLDTSDLVIFDPATRYHRRLTKDEHIFNGVLDSSADRILAVRRNGMWTELVLLDPSGKNINQLISGPGLYFEAPTWSSDGKLIASAVKTGQNSDIILIDPASGAAKTLFKSDIEADNDPDFAPNNDFLVFSSNRSGIWNIYAWDLFENKLFQQTSVLYGATEPRVSPDGKWLSFLSLHRGQNRLCIIPFSPKTGHEINVSAGASLDCPDLNRLQPEIIFEDTDPLQWSSYKPFIHMPYLSIDEDGTVAGIAVMGADPLGINTYLANVFYGFKSLRAGYDLSLINKSFWPVINSRAYDSAIEGNTLGNGKDYWFRERGAELAFRQDIINQIFPFSVNSSFCLGSRFRKFDTLNNDISIGNDDQSMAAFAEITLSILPDSIRRDMIPQWGHEFSFLHEEAYAEFGGELPGHNQIFSIKQNIPSLFKHHGFQLNLNYQNQRGFLYYDKTGSIPRGYSGDDPEGGINLRKNLLTSAEYHFPFWYPDRGPGLSFIHFNVLKGSVFFDYGAGWNHDFDSNDWADRARSTIGGSISAKTSILALVPLEIGMEGGYKIKEEESFANLILKITY